MVLAADDYAPQRALSGVVVERDARVQQPQRAAKRVLESFRQAAVRDRGNYEVYDRIKERLHQIPAKKDASLT